MSDMTDADINEDMAAELKALRADIQPLLADNNRLRAALAAREWQPIETAPMDGTPIDVWCGIFTRTPDAWYNGRNWVYLGPADETGCRCEVETHTSPTHWMPLPDAPVTV